MPTLSRKCGRALSVPQSVSQRERESVRERVCEREREGERDKEIERDKEGERVREREREGETERDVKYGCLIFIFKRNDGCLGTFNFSSVIYVFVLVKLQKSIRYIEWMTCELGPML
jgi:hypothetical protein